MNNIIMPFAAGYGLQGTLLLASSNSGGESGKPVPERILSYRSPDQSEYLLHDKVHAVQLEASAPKRLQERGSLLCEQTYRLTEQQWHALTVYSDHVVARRDPRSEMIALEKSLAMATGFADNEQQAQRRQLSALHAEHERTLLKQISREMGIHQHILRDQLKQFKWYGGYIRHMSIERNLSRRNRVPMSQLWQALSVFDGLHFLQDLRIRGDADAVLQSLETAQVKLPVLRRLDLRFCLLKEPSLQLIAGLEHLTCLELGDTRITDEDLRYPAALQQLTALDLWGNGITGSGLRYLSGSKYLRQLELAATRLTRPHINQVNDLTQLSRLNLECTRIEDEDLVGLARLQRLTTLDLWNTGITDRALDSLLPLENLCELNLELTQVTPEGVNAFRKRHPHGSNIIIHTS